MTEIPVWRLQTRKVEDAIWARQQAFEKRFCHNEMLIEASFTSDSFSVIFVAPTGGTWADSFSLDKLSEFFQDHPV
jgi:hypothetical protein